MVKTPALPLNKHLHSTPEAGISGLRQRKLTLGSTAKRWHCATAHLAKTRVKLCLLALTTKKICQTFSHTHPGLLVVASGDVKVKTSLPPWFLCVYERVSLRKHTNHVRSGGVNLGLLFCT